VNLKNLKSAIARLAIRFGWSKVKARYIKDAFRGNAGEDAEVSSPFVHREVSILLGGVMKAPIPHGRRHGSPEAKGTTPWTPPLAYWGRRRD